MNKKLNLIREYFALCPDGMCCVDLLTEAEKRMKNDGYTILSGVLQAANTKNGNGRLYPRRILEREMENYEKVIREKRAVGELDHADDPVINLKNVSHMVLRSWWDGEQVRGTVKVLNTPTGQTLQSLVKDGVNIGISSRGLGSVKETSEGIIVEDDFQLICFDIVSEPSTPNAYLSLQEAKINERKILTKSDRIYRALNDVLRK